MSDYSHIDKLSKQANTPREPEPSEEEFETFLGWMADRILQRKIVDTREKAIWTARCYMQVEESDGQGGRNKTFGKHYVWNETFAHDLADDGIQRQIWQDEEC